MGGAFVSASLFPGKGLDISKKSYIFAAETPPFALCACIILLPTLLQGGVFYAFLGLFWDFCIKTVLLNG